MQELSLYVDITRNESSFNIWDQNALAGHSRQDFSRSPSWTSRVLSLDTCQGVHYTTWLKECSHVDLLSCNATFCGKHIALVLKDCSFASLKIRDLRAVESLKMDGQKVPWFHIATYSFKYCLQLGFSSKSKTMINALSVYRVLKRKRMKWLERVLCVQLQEVGGSQLWSRR